MFIVGRERVERIERVEALCTQAQPYTWPRVVHRTAETGVAPAEEIFIHGELGGSGAHQ